MELWKDGGNISKGKSESSRAQGFYVPISHNYNISLDAILGRILQLQLHLYSYIA
jgi:hypothetical protein